MLSSGDILYMSPPLFDRVKSKYLWFENTHSIQASYKNSNKDLDFIRLEKKSFESSPDISIDYALMEKSKNVVMVPLEAEWSDVGSWKVLSEIEKKDSDGNVIKGDVVSIETKNTYINAQHKLITTIGLKDLIIVDTPDAESTVICPKHQAKI